MDQDAPLRSRHLARRNLPSASSGDPSLSVDPSLSLDPSVALDPFVSSVSLGTNGTDGVQVTGLPASFGEYHDYDDDGLNIGARQPEKRMDEMDSNPLDFDSHHFNHQAQSLEPSLEPPLEPRIEHVSPFRAFQAHPRDTCHCVYFGLLLAGVGFLLPYDSFVSAVDYFQQKYPGSSVIFDMSFVYILTAFGAVLINNMIVESISMYRRIYFGYCLSFGTLLVVALVEISWDSFPLVWAYNLNLVSVAVVAFGCTIQQASFYGFASMLPPRYTQAVMAGESASGLIVSINRIVTKALLRDEKISTLLFFFLSISIIVVCILIHNVLQKTAFVQFHLKACQSHLRTSQNGSEPYSEHRRSTYVSSGNNFDYNCTNDRVILGISSATASYHSKGGHLGEENSGWKEREKSGWKEREKSGWKEGSSKPKEDLALVELESGIENQMYGSTSFTSDLTDILTSSSENGFKKTDILTSSSENGFKKTDILTSTEKGSKKTALFDPECDSLQDWKLHRDPGVRVRPSIDVDLLENCPPVGSGTNPANPINPNYDLDNDSFLNLCTSENLARSSQRLLFPSTPRVSSGPKMWVSSGPKMWVSSSVSSVKSFFGYYWDRVCLILATRIRVVSLTWPFMVSILTAYLITFSLFPGIESEIVSCHFKSWMPVLLLFTFDSAEFVGKISSGCLYGMKPLNLMIMCVSRVLLIPLLCFCVAPRTHPLFAHESWSFIFSILLGLTNGICASLPMILAPTRVSSDLKEITGNLMTLSYSIGLTTGSGLAYAVRATLGPPVTFHSLCNGTDSTLSSVIVVGENFTSLNTSSLT